MPDYIVEIGVPRVLEISLPSAQGLRGPQGPSATNLSFIAGEALGGHRIVVTNDAGQAIYADHAEVTHAVKVAGMTTGAASLGAAVQVLAAGELEEPSWSWTPGQALYLGSNGLIATVSPSTGFSLCVGFAVTATRIIVKIGQPIILA